MICGSTTAFILAQIAGRLARRGVVGLGAIIDQQVGLQRLGRERQLLQPSGWA
jgi:hypothetical protein